MSQYQYGIQRAPGGEQYERGSLLRIAKRVQYKFSTSIVEYYTEYRRVLLRVQYCYEYMYSPITRTVPSTVHVAGLWTRRRRGRRRESGL